MAIVRTVGGALRRGASLVCRPFPRQRGGQLLGAILIGLCARLSGAAELTVTSVSPPNAAVHAPILSPITVHFDRPVNPASVTNASFWAFARTSGTVTGSFLFADGNATVTLVPDRPLFWGSR